MLFRVPTATATSGFALVNPKVIKISMPRIFADVIILLTIPLSRAPIQFTPVRILTPV